MIELRLTKKETVILITALKTASFWNEVEIDLIDNILAENLITKLNKKLIEEILEEPEEKEKEDNLSI